SLPQNRNSTCLSIAGPLTGVGNANPSAVPAGGNSLLTVAVTPATSPASTGLAVVIDLSAIGGSLTQTMFDDGTNGDVTPADNTFSFLATVGISTTQGLKSMPYTISDQQARTFNAGINLTVLEPVPTRRATWGKLKFIY